MMLPPLCFLLRMVCLGLCVTANVTVKVSFEQKLLKRLVERTTNTCLSQQKFEKVQGVHTIFSALAVVAKRIDNSSQ